MLKFLSKLKREERNLVYTLIVFAILLSIFFIYNFITDLINKNKSKKEENVSKNLIIQNFDKNKIFKIEIEYFDEISKEVNNKGKKENITEKKKVNLLLVKNNGNWSYLSHKDLEISQSSVDLFLDYFKSLEYSDLIEQYNDELLETCGLKDYKFKIKIYETENKYFELLLGKETVDKYGYYIMYNGKIFVIDSFSYGGIAKKVSDFRQNKIFAKLPISELGSYFFGNYIDNIQNKFYLLNNSWVWNSNYQREYYFNLQNPAIDELNRVLLEFEVTEFDLKYKDINKPEYVIEIRKINGDLVLKLILVEPDDEVSPEEKLFTIYDTINKKAYKAYIKNLYSYFTKNPNIFSKIREEKK
ncbi:MAG: DUF4340 domain-containing protein [Spirochaetes bacterium]|nr:DUF4340 domain-containing protein [Spirochaetota bacterium]